MVFLQLKKNLQVETLCSSELIIILLKLDISHNFNLMTLSVNNDNVITYNVKHYIYIY